METFAPVFVSEQYKRNEYPRPACIHDPSGLLERCDRCNFLGHERGQVVLSEK